MGPSRPLKLEISFMRKERQDRRTTSDLDNASVGRTWVRRTEEAEAHFSIFVHLLAVWRETSWPGTRRPHHPLPPPRAIKPPTRSKQPRDLRSTLDLQKENIASRLEEGTMAVAHSPLLTTPINHLNSGLACPTHAKDGRSARLEGSSWIISLAPQTTVALVGKAGGREGLRRLASTPFQTDDHSCENGRGGSGRRSERQNACEAA